MTLGTSVDPIGLARLPRRRLRLLRRSHGGNGRSTLVVFIVRVSGTAVSGRARAGGGESFFTWLGSRGGEGQVGGCQVREVNYGIHRTAGAGGILSFV